MKSNKLADYDHPLVQATAHRLTRKESTVRGKLQRLFHYVRDDIKFYFPRNGDLVKASETISLGKGQCNTKGTLFLALCKAAGIPARIHFSLIRKEIQRGLFTGLAYWLMPSLLSHSWLEVEIEGKWRTLDSYINDEEFYLAGKMELEDRGWNTGFSIACESGKSSAAFNIDEEAFVQMEAVVEDHGAWEDPIEYYQTDNYKNRPNAFKLFFYRMTLGRINGKVDDVRKKCAGSLCSQCNTEAA